MRPFSLLALLVIMVLAGAVPAARPATAAPAASPFNARLAINVGADGKFNLGALPDPQTGGAVAGSSWDLSFTWPDAPWSSFTTIRINGVDSIYGESGTQVQAPTDVGSMNESAWRIGDTEVTQQLEIVLNPQTGQEDTAKIAYTVRNVGTTDQTVGTRVMIDTELNYNDGAPFRVPGDGIIRNEKEYSGSAVPDTFQAFFGLDDSTHVAASTLKGGDATPPDRLVLGSWPRIKQTLYEYTPDTNVSFGETGSKDSAYAVYWNPQPLAPGASRTYVTYYGLSALNVDLRPPLALGVSGPATLTIDGNGYTPNPFDITATVFNNGTAAATNVQLTLDLPDWLALVEGDPTRPIGDLTVGAEQQEAWRVYAPLQPITTTLIYTVTAAAANTASKTLTRTIVLPAFTSPSAPQPTTSYYMTSVDPTDAFNLGCEARQNGERGIVILNFGSPRNQDAAGNPMQGTRLVKGQRFFVNLAEIATAVKSFGRGYTTCQLPVGDDEVSRDLIVSIGTTNSQICPNDDLDNCETTVDNEALDAGSGQAWANMVIGVNNWFRVNGYPEGIKAAGGYDAEFGEGWNSSGTLMWANGYTSVMASSVQTGQNLSLLAPFYNFGSCEGCPRETEQASWTAAQEQRLDTVFQLSQGLRFTRALPQIYFAPYAQEWYNVRRYAISINRTMTISGVMTGCGLAPSVPGCSFNDPRQWPEFPLIVTTPNPRCSPQKPCEVYLPPKTGWQAMYDRLTAPTAPDGSLNTTPQTTLPWLTDIINQ